MKQVCEALHMLRNFFRTRAVRQADEALLASNHINDRIERLAAEETRGSQRIRTELRRLQNAIERGRQ